MTSKYGSLLFTPEEYYEITPFRFPIYHDLVPGEARGMEEISRVQSKNTFKSLKIAQKIAKTKGIPTKEAIDLLANLGEAENSEMIYEFAEELEDLQRDSMGDISATVKFVTLFMRYRAEAQLNNKKKWEKLDDWTEEDTESMPAKVMTSIYELMVWERDGWPKEGNDQSAENES